MSKLEFVAHCPREVSCANDQAALLESASGHYAPSDRPLFVSGYNALCAVDLKGKRALEVCCGRGELAVQFARACPDTEVIANDRYPEAGAVIREAQRHGEVPNLKYECGDALALKPHPDASLDLVFGQAALHHLAHDIGSVSLEYSRVLKPGGRLIFIFEPLGHNPLFAMIRAWRVSRGTMGDESNVFFGQLQEIGRNFSRCEVQVFNILGYPLKGVHGVLGERLARWSHAADAAWIAAKPGRAKLAANFNVIFTK